MADKVAVETPGRTSHGVAVNFGAMLDVAGRELLTDAEMKTAILPQLSEDLFPSEATAGWSVICVQLDIEAKGLPRRHETRPLTLWRP